MCVSGQERRLWILCPSYKSQYTIALINFNLLTRGVDYKTAVATPKQGGGTDSHCYMRMVLIHFPFVEETI